MGRFNEKLFIEKFSEIKSGSYDYLGYENGLVKFLCKKHDLIGYATPSHLLRKGGCVECAKEKRKEWNDLQNKNARESFIEKAKQIHGEKFDYSKVNYINSQTKVSIICPIHGEFEMLPNAHLRGEGCKKCGIEHSHNLSRISPKSL
jgi:hypothetical protein